MNGEQAWTENKRERRTSVNGEKAWTEKKWSRAFGPRLEKNGYKRGRLQAWTRTKRGLEKAWTRSEHAIQKMASFGVELEASVDLERA